MIDEKLETDITNLATLSFLGLHKAMLKRDVAVSGTNDLRVQWWVQYEIAARKIQRAFRCWNSARHFRRSYSRKMKIELASKPVFPTLEDSFRNVIAEDASFDNKMTVWRAAIELRRAHKAHSTDLILRALIDSGGDLSRAIVLMGTKDYALLNKGELPSKLRRIFLPKLETQTISVENPFQPMLMASLRKTMNLNHICDDDNNPMNNISFKQNSVNIIRSLRGLKGKQIVYEQSREEKRAELFLILNTVVERAFMSANHVGSKDFKRAQRIPHILSAKSAARLEKQNMEMMSPTLEYLMPKPFALKESIV